MASSLPPPDPELVRDIIKGGSHVLVIAFCMFILWTWSNGEETAEERRHEVLLEQLKYRNEAMRTLLEQCRPRPEQQSQIRSVPTIPITPKRGPAITNGQITERFGPFVTSLEP